MDRRNFIQSTYLNIIITDDNKCGNDDCECDESFQTPNNSSYSFEVTLCMRLFAIALFAFICAFVFSIIKTNTANATLLLHKRNTAISCGPADLMNKKEKFNNDHQSNSDDKSSCPHQLGSSCLCINDSKRKRNGMT